MYPLLPSPPSTCSLCVVGSVRQDSARWSGKRVCRDPRQAEAPPRPPLQLSSRRLKLAQGLSDLMVWRRLGEVGPEASGKELGCEQCLAPSARRCVRTETSSPRLGLLTLLSPSSWESWDPVGTWARAIPGGGGPVARRGSWDAGGQGVLQPCSAGPEQCSGAPRPPRGTEHEQPLSSCWAAALCPVPPSSAPCLFFPSFRTGEITGAVPQP